MKGFSFIVFFVYIVLVIYILPKRMEFDLYKLEFRLFPHWFKIFALAYIVLSAIIALLFSSSIEKSDEYLISSINLSLFVILFSKQKHEDEFSEQIRFKSFTYSFVVFLALAGAFGAISINQNETRSILSNFNLHLLVGLSMFMSLLYFYITLFKSRKLKN
jgi:hypothetical protein